VLWEVADIVEQISCTENLRPRPEEYDAAACDYQADHGLTYSGMCEAMRQYGTLTEIHERAQVIALMRLYGRRWRPLAPGGRRASRAPCEHGVFALGESATPVRSSAAMSLTGQSRHFQSVGRMTA
jgi:hypothetical protein